MSRNRFVWSGLHELKAALRRLPTELAGEGARIIADAANDAVVDIRSAYGAHRQSGRLQASVDMELHASGFGASAIVRARAPHATLVERGTQVRYTRAGAHRGSMPAANIFVPRMIRARQRMYTELAGLLERQGLTVSGEM